MSRKSATTAPINPAEMVPAYRLRATQAVLADRERELLRLKGPCSTSTCCLHYAHSGPCDITPIPKPLPTHEGPEPAAGAARASEEGR